MRTDSPKPMPTSLHKEELVICKSLISRLRPRTRAFLVAALMLGVAQLPANVSAVAQYGPPSSGSSSAIIFTPATVGLVAGLNGQGSSGNGGLATAAKLNYPVGIAYDSSGNLFVADGQNYVVRRIDHVTQDISVFAGTSGTFGNSLGGGVATSAQLGLLAGLVIDTGNNVYVSDRSNNVVWKITPGGTISVYAGGGSSGLGDGGPATSGKLNNPWALGIDASNNIYISDSYNDLVRVVNHSTNIITTFAGVVADAAGGFGSCSAGSLYSTSTPPYTPTQAHLCFPQGVAFDSSGNAYLVDIGNKIVRVVNSSTGFISTFAGGGSQPNTVNGIAATSASLSPSGVYVDPSNRVYIADSGGGLIRVVDSSGNINTVFGTGSGSMTSAILGEPDTESVNINIGPADGIDDMTMDIFGNLIASDSSGSAITTAGGTGQYVFPQTQIFTTKTTTQLNATSAFYPPYLTISNPSGVALNFTGTPVVTGPFAVVTGTGAGTCTFPGSVAAGKSCTVVMSFTPTLGGSPGTVQTGSIVLTSNANSSPSTISLSGTGTGTATVTATLTPFSLVFTSQAGVTSAAQQATLTNTGQIPIAVGSTDFDGVSASFFALSGTTCPTGAATLAVGATCTYSITFTPNVATTYSAGFQSCISTASYGCLSNLLQGTGTAAPTATLLPTPLAFGNVVQGQLSAPMSATLTNTGSGTLNISSFTITGANPADFAVSTGTNACGSTLAAGASCFVYVTFTPATANSFSAQLSVADNAASSPQTVSLTGTGIPAAAPVAGLSPTPLAFPNTTVASTAAALPVTLSNTGNATMTGIAFSITGTNPGDFATTSATTCGTTLAAGSSCTIYVSFTPATATSFTATLSVADNATGSPQTVTLTGTGTTAPTPQASLSPNPLAFPATLVGTAATSLPMTLSNAGTAALTITSISVTGTNASSFGQTNNCGASLAAGANCIITATFTPAAAGSLSASISVVDNATGSPHTAALTGTGTAPQTSFTQTSLTFPGTLVGTSAGTQSTTLSNPGTAALTIIGISITGTSASSFSQSNTCGASLAAAASCTITVTFTPGSAGSLSASLSVGDNATGSPQTVTLTGTGTAPQAVLSPNPLAFPNTLVGTAATPLPMTLSNPGTAVLTITSISVSGTNASSFGQSNNCGASLAAGASCTISVTFTPGSVAALTAAISVVDGASGSPHTAALTGTGTAPLVPQAVLSPNPLAFPSTTINTSATPLPMTLSNPGNAPLTISGISVTGANASSFGETSTCGSTLAAGASCTITVTFTPASAATFTAAITVADNAAGSPQSAVITGIGSAGTYVVNASTPTQTVQPGGVAQFNLVVAPLGGSYNNLVTLTASGLPAGATYTFLPAAVTPGIAGAPSVLSIQTSTGLARLRLPEPQRRSPAPLLALFLGVPLLGVAGSLRRFRRSSQRWMLLGLAALAILPILALSGCGGGYFGPAPQTYNITVTGTSGALQESTTISLTVQ